MQQRPKETGLASPLTSDQLLEFASEGSGIISWADRSTLATKMYGKKEEAKAVGKLELFRTDDTVRPELRLKMNLSI